MLHGEENIGSIYITRGITLTAARIPASTPAPFHISCIANVMQPSTERESDLPKAALQVCGSSIRNSALTPSALTGMTRWCFPSPGHAPFLWNLGHAWGAQQASAFSSIMLIMLIKTSSEKLLWKKEKEAADLWSSSMADHGEIGKIHYLRS